MMTFRFPSVRWSPSLRVLLAVRSHETTLRTETHRSPLFTSDMGEKATLSMKRKISDILPT